MSKDSENVSTLPAFPCSSQPSSSGDINLSATEESSWTDEDGKTHALHLWPCAPFLAQYIWSNKDKVRGKNIIELGAGGTGLPGMTALRCGASRVVFMDHPAHADAARLLRRNLSRNRLEERSSVVGLCWGQVEEMAEWDSVDVVLASDCFFDPSVFPHLICTIAWILQANPASYCLFSYQVRDANWRFGHLLSEWGLVAEEIPPEEFHEPCVSVPGFNDELRSHSIVLGCIRQANVSPNEKQ